MPWPATAASCGRPSSTPAARAWSFPPSGSPIEVLRRGSAPEFVVADVDGFTWHPNGQQLAYTVNRQMFLAPGDIGPMNGGDWVAGPAWSPDGTQIAFHGNPEKNVGGSCATFKMNADDTGLTLLAEGRRARNHKQSSILHYEVDWSPSGTHLMYTERDVSAPGPGTDVSVVRIMTADGSDNHALATNGGPTGAFGLGWQAD